MVDSYDPRTPQSPFDRELARKAWDAALASPEVQLLKNGEKITDRELLELAAKAVGYQPEMVRPELGGTLIDFGDRRVWWNPLIDDGDALRLAVALQLGISIPPVVDGCIDVVTFYGPIISIVEYPQNDDRNAATRRAIVRAAAEIGKQRNSYD